MSHDHHHHDHTPPNFNRAFAIGIALNALFVAIEAFYGWRVNSLALLADIAAASGKSTPALTAAAEHALKAYPWPGNIRELKNALERASLMSDGRTIAHDVLFDRPAPPLNAQQDVAGSLRDYLAECERDFIVRALGACQWQIQCCADSLGISRKNLWEKMRKLGIDKPGESE